MNWKEISGIAKEGYKIGLIGWHKDSFWPVDNNGDVVVGGLQKFNPELFNSDQWVILIDNPNQLNDDDYRQKFDSLNETYKEIIKKLEWFVGAGNRNPLFMQNFESFIRNQLEKLKGI